MFFLTGITHRIAHGLLWFPALLDTISGISAFLCLLLHGGTPLSHDGKEAMAWVALERREL
ncbi:hypothetical protein MB02_16725 [Croceicoccus estronivorus]|nr:hypothetical protein MB02_16725 [Croceicoccus estronivorus]